VSHTSRILLVSTLLAACATAGTVVTANNAGGLPGTAEDLSAIAVTEIQGSIPVTTDPLAGVNMFLINIIDPEFFSAIAVPVTFGIADTDLFLFDSSGNGVLANDDISFSNTLSCLPSADAGTNPCDSSLPGGLGPVSPGLYYLAISSSANYPTSGGNEIFNIQNSTDVVGPALTGSNPVDNFDGNYFTSTDTDLVNYDILLTGTTPEPSTWILACAALGVTAFLRRRSKLKAR